MQTMKKGLNNILVRVKKKKGLHILAAAFILTVGIGTLTGCSASGDNQLIKTAQTDSPYQLKQIYMCDAHTGWAISEDNQVLYTDNGVENFTPIKTLENISSATDGFVNAAFVNAQSAYVAYTSEENKDVIVEYTDDGGSTWNQTTVNYAEFLGGCDAGSVYISFTDAGNGYLLYCSSPAAGLMTKLLFATEDAGESFSFVNDLSGELTGYPQGIAFTGEGIGYIAVTYHGEDNYLYRTTDGAGTLESINPLSEDKNVRYIDGYAPVFYGEDKQTGMMVLKAVGDKAAYKLLTTVDGGGNWAQEGELPVEALAGYSAAGGNGLLFIDGEGNVLVSENRQSSGR